VTLPLQTVGGGPSGIQWYWKIIKLKMKEKQRGGELGMI
jgi:hypothetical protein